MMKEIKTNQAVVKVIAKELNGDNYHINTYLCDYDLNLNFLIDALESVLVNTTNKPVWIEYQTGDKMGVHCAIVHDDYTLECTGKSFIEYMELN